MRLLLPILLVLQSCSWSQAEFRKWSQKDDVKNSDKQLEKVGVDAAEAEKFSVEEAPAPVAPTTPEPAPTASIKPKSPVRPAPTTDKKPVVSAKPAPVKKTVLPVVAVSTTPTYPDSVPEEVRKLDERTELAWRNFKPTFADNEIHFMDVDYLGMTVGKVSMSYRGIKLMNGKEVYHFQARFKTAPFYSSLYELNDTIDTYVSKEGFRGLRYNLVQRESKQNVDEVQLYDQEKLHTTAYQKQVRPDKTKNRKWDGPMPRYNIDSFSAIYLIRGLPLKPGDNYAITIVNKAKLLVLDLKVELREKIRLHGKDRETLRVHAFTKYSGSTLKSGDMTFWLADNATRELLRAKAEIKIGSVYVEASDKE